MISPFQFRSVEGFVRCTEDILSGRSVFRVYGDALGDRDRSKRLPLHLDAEDGHALPELLGALLRERHIRFREDQDKLFTAESTRDIRRSIRPVPDPLLHARRYR
jgi:hypothetical protein